MREEDAVALMMRRRMSAGERRRGEDTWPLAVTTVCGGAGEVLVSEFKTKTSS